MLTANTFHDLMGKSPLPALQQHLALAVESTEQIPTLLEATTRPDSGDLKALGFKVSDLAQQADTVYGQLARDWPKGVLLPIRRRDLAFVLESQDQILDVSRQISALLQLPLDVPTEVNSLMSSLAACGVKTAGRALRVIESLEIAIRSGLKGRDVSSVYGLVDDVRHSHDQARALVDELRTTLQENCKEQDTVSLVFMLELTRLLGELSRHAERAAARALLLVSR
jgi:predicted phosphate transport protein (TIGR00153 family)